MNDKTFKILNDLFKRGWNIKIKTTSSLDNEKYVFTVAHECRYGEINWNNEDQLIIRSVSPITDGLDAAVTSLIQQMIMTKDQFCSELKYKLDLSKKEMDVLKSRYNTILPASDSLFDILSAGWGIDIKDGFVVLKNKNIDKLTSIMFNNSIQLSSIESNFNNIIYNNILDRYNKVILALDELPQKKINLYDYGYNFIIQDYDVYGEPLVHIEESLVSLRKAFNELDSIQLIIGEEKITLESNEKSSAN